MIASGRAARPAGSAAPAWARSTDSARATRLGRLVAIKLRDAQSPHFTERLIAEARITARCSHHTIVVIHDAGEHQGHPTMILEYLEAQTLRPWMGERASRHRRAARRQESIVVMIGRGQDAMS